MVKKLIVYDLDGTLAESKSSLDTEMSALLHDLLGIVKVAVISGGDWPQFQKQLLSNLPQDDRLPNLSLLPTCGTKFYQFAGEWKKIYEEDFAPAEREKIVSSLTKALSAVGFKIEKIWGKEIEDRGSQITFSALGQQAPLAEKEKWDPDFAKRKKIKAILDTFIPEFSVRLGGATSIDVTKPGIDKDPRVTFVESFQRYVMTYAAFSPRGPWIALAVSEDLFHWERLGLATFEPYDGIDFVHVDNKDASLFPVAIPNHVGKMQLALLHRPRRVKVAFRYKEDRPVAPRVENYETRPDARAE